MKEAFKYPVRLVDLGIGLVLGIFPDLGSFNLQWGNVCGHLKTPSMVDRL